MAAVFLWKKELIIQSFEEMRTMSVFALVLCLLLCLLYQLGEGAAAAILADIPLINGIACALFNSFYNLATAGTGAGVAQIYYLSKCSVSTERAAGTTIIQYALHKTASTILGIIAFLLLLAMGEHQMRAYAFLAASLSALSLAVSAVLILLCVSKPIGYLCVRAVKIILKNKPNLERKAGRAIIDFIRNGRQLAGERKKIIAVLFIDMEKLLMYYFIPAVVIGSKMQCNWAVITATMAVVVMMGSVMGAPAGVGTLEYIFSLFFASQYGAVAATAIILYRMYSLLVPFVLGIPVVLKDRRGHSPSGKI